MDHEALRDKVFELYDGELPGAERPLVEAHRASCGTCADELELWKRAARRLAGAPAPAGSERFVRSVMARLEEPAAPSWRESLRNVFSMPRFAAAGAALAAVALFVASRPDLPAPAADEAVLIAELIEDTTARPDREFGTLIEEYLL